MDNFIKYYSYFVSEYVVEALYDDFAPDDNMVSSGTNMLSYIADLGTDGEIKHSDTNDLYEVVARVVQAMFTNTTQYFVTNDRTIIKIEDLTFEDIVKITNDLVAGMDSEEFLHKLDSGDYLFKFETVDADNLKYVGSACIADVHTNDKFVGAIPQIYSFIEKVRENLNGDYSINNVVEESFVEEDVYSALDFV